MLLDVRYIDLHSLFYEANCYTVGITQDCTKGSDSVDIFASPPPSSLLAKNLPNLPNAMELDKMQPQGERTVGGLGPWKQASSLSNWILPKERLALVT